MLLALLTVLLAACGDADGPTPEGGDLRAADGVIALNRSQGKGTPGGGAAELWLTVLHHNDGESKLLPEDGIGGAALFAAAVEELRGEATEHGACFGDERSDPRARERARATKCAALLVSSGDNFLAGPILQVSRNADTFYDALAMDLIGYDAIGIGNHEFDFGPSLLDRFIDAFSLTRPGFLTANLDAAGTVLEGDVAPYAVVERLGEGVGVIGATTEDLASISNPGPVRVGAVLPAIRAAVSELESAGVDKIVLVSHLQSLRADEALVRQLRGVDVVVAGGGDELLANPDDELLPGDRPRRGYPLLPTDAEGRRVPLVTTVGGYEYLGRLTVGFDGDGRVTGIRDDASGPVPVSSSRFRPDAELEVEVEEPVAAAVEALKSSVLATHAVDLDATRPTIRTRETNAGNLAADAFRFAASRVSGGDVQVAIANGGGLRGAKRYEAPEFTEFESLEFLAFPSFMVVTEDLTPANLKAVLEHAYGALPASAGKFAQVSGIEVTVDPSMPAGSRVTTVRLDDGTPIVTGGALDPAAPAALTVATLDFLAAGGDDYDWGGTTFTEYPLTYQGALADYLTAPPSEVLGGLGGLGGVIPDGSGYQAGGDGRITILP